MHLILQFVFSSFLKFNANALLIKFDFTGFEIQRTQKRISFGSGSGRAGLSGGMPWETRGLRARRVVISRLLDYRDSDEMRLAANLLSNTLSTHSLHNRALEPLD
jgi:hypothetical protein